MVTGGRPGHQQPGRQRHIDDDGVEHDHELGGGDDLQSEAGAAVAAADRGAG